MSGILIGIRQTPLTSSFGAIFFHFAKTAAFELFVNHENLEAAHKSEKNQSEAPVTLTYLPGATPEELTAQCDPTAPGRKYCDVLHEHDEGAGWFEETGHECPCRRGRV